MKSFLTIIKLDYLTRIRSYSFLITLCFTIAIAYTFVPEPNANYSTIRIGGHVGYYNSAWFGYVTAMMTSIFLSLIGFYLINNSIKKDIRTKVGQIVAATKIKNFTYLLSRVLSNFLVLATIVFLTFLMSIVLFFLYNDGFNFEISQFIKPYLIITLPSIFCISVLAVLFEVMLGRYAAIQNVVFFFVFSFLMLFSPKSESQYGLDVFGNKVVIDQMEELVHSLLPGDKDHDMTIGYVLGNTKQAKKFNFNGIDFSFFFLVSRVLWILFGIALIALVAPFFHRFNIRDVISSVKAKKEILSTSTSKEIVLSALPVPDINYNILPFIKTEVLLLLRKGNKWLWALNLLGMILLAFLPIDFAHQFILPILWFLQVNRISDLTTKEVENNVFYFTFSSFGPLRRLLVSQLIAGSLLMLFLASPLLFRYIFMMDINASLLIVFGGIFIVFLAGFLGIFTEGKKLFEVLFFFMAYANINKIPLFDYFGGVLQNTTQVVWIFLLIGILGIASFFKRNYDINK